MTYKIKLFKYKLQASIDDDIPKVVAYFKLHNIDVVFNIQETQVTKDFALLQLMQPNDGTCDVVMYVYDRNTFNAPTNGLAFRVSDTLRGVYLGTSIVDDNVEYTWKSIIHELMHTLFMKLIPNGNGNIPLDSMLVEVNCTTGLPLK